MRGREEFYESRLTPEQKKAKVRVKLSEKGIEPQDGPGSGG